LLAATLTGAALLAGCATPTTVFEGRYAMRDGWHRATVDRTVSDADLPPLLRPDCPPPASGTTTAQLWVLVDYRPAGRPRRAAVPVPAGTQHASGTPVYVQVQGCQRALAPRAAPA
jgi:hypothetical protein